VWELAQPEKLSLSLSLQSRNYDRFKLVRKKNP